MEQAIVGVLLLGGIVALVVKKLKKKKEAEDEDEAEDAAFDAIDTNRDGRISAKEEFAALDTNKDGKISRDEWSAGFELYTRGMNLYNSLSLRSKIKQGIAFYQACRTA